MKHTAAQENEFSAHGYRGRGRPTGLKLPLSESLYSLMLWRVAWVLYARIRRAYTVGRTAGSKLSGYLAARLWSKTSCLRSHRRSVISRGGILALGIGGEDCMRIKIQTTFESM